VVSGVKRFQNIVWEHYRAHKREMPWRNDIAPYRVFVSEVMLQQTQVARVAEKFPAFTKMFPDFQALAAAPLKRVLAAWQGMGYNRRALYLKRAAEMVAEKHAGKLPRDVAALEALPGIGPATARSIAVFAWNSPQIFIETNIRSVFLHHFFPGRTATSDAELLPFIQKALDTENAREWYYALMDYGAWLKKEHGNAGKRSKHYAKQPPFAGSNREVRGKVLRALSGNKQMTLAMLMRACGEAKVKTGFALRGLIRDGLVRKNKNNFSIA
jgi:A/G-specific adenine glycosylase